MEDMPNDQRNAPSQQSHGIMEKGMGDSAMSTFLQPCYHRGWINLNKLGYPQNSFGGDDPHPGSMVVYCSFIIYHIN